MHPECNTIESFNQKQLKLILINIAPIPFLATIFAGILLLIAGNIQWINCWAFVLSHTLYLIVSSLYLITKNPDALKNRNKLSISLKDLPFLLLFSFCFTVIFLLSALNFRFEWNKLPLYFSAVGMVFLLAAYILYIKSMYSNPFASKGLLLHKGQTIVSDGPYRYIRHPIYTASILLGVGISLTLGSPVSLIPAAALPFVYAMRIRKEERILSAEFPEYQDYTKKAADRLIPGIW